MERAYKCRFYPTPDQAALLSRTFGCCRFVYNRALDARTRAWFTEQRRVNYNQSSAMLTEWKRDPEVAWLNDVSCVPLQQSLRHLQGAFARFWEKRTKYPRFKSKHKSRASAEFTRSAFSWRDGELTLAKCGEPLAIVWSRPLPDGAEPSTVTVSRDSAGRWHVSILVDDPTVAPLPPTECAWYGRNLVAIDRWLPTSKTCSACGHRVDALPLGIRELTCAWCGAVHDRDVNAAINIRAAGLAVLAGGDGVRPKRSNPGGRLSVKQETQPATVGIPVL